MRNILKITMSIVLSLTLFDIVAFAANASKNALFNNAELSAKEASILILNAAPTTGDNTFLIILGITMLLALAVFAIVKKII